MRIVYDDTMQETMAAAVGEFMDALNAARMGLPIPGKLKAVLEQLREEKEN